MEGLVGAGDDVQGLDFKYFQLEKMEGILNAQKIAETFRQNEAIQHIILRSTTVDILQAPVFTRNCDTIITCLKNCTPSILERAFSFEKVKI